MPAAPLPKTEARRLRALQAYGVLDTPAEPAFDRLTRLAARLFDVPIALVSLIDVERQWFKSCHGLATTETARDAAFCAYAILATDILEVLDPLADPRFADNPLVLGEPHIRYYAGAPLLTQTGHALGTLCLIDTRGRKALDADQRATLADLAACVMSELDLRLARLESDIAASAAHRLAALSEERLGHMAHDFKTPLTAILGFSQLAQMTADPAKAVGYADTIHKAGQHLLELVSDTLDARARVAGDGTADLAALAEEAAVFCRPLSTVTPIEVTVPSGLAVDMAPVRLREILLNLLSNALKYAPGMPVRVSARVTDGQVEIEVADSGPGIPHTARDRLFDDGVRLDGAEAQAEGHGTGLSVVRTLVTMAGGTVSVHDAPGGGALFRLRLPLRRAAADAGAVVTAGGQPVTTA